MLFKLISIYMHIFGVATCISDDLSLENLEIDYKRMDILESSFHQVGVYVHKYLSCCHSTF